MSSERYITLEDVVKSLEEEYELNQHFSGYVMMVLNTKLDVTVSKELDISYLAKIYKDVDAIPINALYWEVSYENGFSVLSFSSYCQPKISNKLLLDTGSGLYYLYKGNANTFYEKLEGLAEDFKKSSLSPEEIRDFLKEYLDEDLIQLVYLGGSINNKDKVMVNVLNGIRDPTIEVIVDLIRELKEKGVDTKKIIKEHMSNIKFDKTLYGLLLEKCGNDADCLEYTFNKFGRRDFLISNSFVKSYEKYIGDIISGYKKSKKPEQETKEDINYIN